MANNFRIKSFYIAKTLQIKSRGNNNDEKWNVDSKESIYMLYGELLKIYKQMTAN